MQSRQCRFQEARDRWDSEHGRPSKRLKAALLPSPVTPCVWPAIAASTGVTAPVGRSLAPTPRARYWRRTADWLLRAGEGAPRCFNCSPTTQLSGGGSTADYRDHLRRAGRARWGKSYAYYVHTNTHTTPHELVILSCLRIQGPNILVPPIPSSSSSILPLPPSSSISLISISLPQRTARSRRPAPFFVDRSYSSSAPTLSSSLSLSPSLFLLHLFSHPHLSSPLRTSPPLASTAHLSYTTASDHPTERPHHQLPAPSLTGRLPLPITATRPDGTPSHRPRN